MFSEINQVDVCVHPFSRAYTTPDQIRGKTYASLIPAWEERVSLAISDPQMILIVLSHLMSSEMHRSKIAKVEARIFDKKCPRVIYTSSDSWESFDSTTALSQSTSLSPDAKLWGYGEYFDDLACVPRRTNVIGEILRIPKQNYSLRPELSIATYQRFD